MKDDIHSLREDFCALCDETCCERCHVLEFSKCIINKVIVKGERKHEN